MTPRHDHEKWSLSLFLFLSSLSRAVVIQLLKAWCVINYASADVFSSDVAQPNAVTVRRRIPLNCASMMQIPVRNPLLSVV